MAELKLGFMVGDVDRPPGSFTLKVFVTVVETADAFEHVITLTYRFYQWKPQTPAWQWSSAGDGQTYGSSPFEPLREAALSEANPLAAVLEARRLEAVLEELVEELGASMNADREGGGRNPRLTRELQAIAKRHAETFSQAEGSNELTDSRPLAAAGASRG